MGTEFLVDALTVRDAPGYRNAAGIDKRLQELHEVE